MIKINELSVARGGKTLYADANVSIYSGQKVAIVGANGSGKTSLFHLLLNKLAVDRGAVEIPETWVVAEVEQETPQAQQTAIDHVISGDQELSSLRVALELAEQRADHSEIARLHGLIDNIDGYTASARAEKLMFGLGFGRLQVNTPVTQFSGGWQVRLKLARALMCRSDLLLLDEPTNHLDLDAVIWLEQWLKSYPGTLLLISHDRDFIDRVVDQVVHIEQHRFFQYSGNYSQFEETRAQRLALQQSLYKKQQTQIAHMQAFVRRFKAKASKAKQAQSRLKALQRMEAIIPAHVDSPFVFQFFKPEQVPHTFLELSNVDVGYDKRNVLCEVNLRVEAGARIGLLGPNGAGKSTLIKLIAQRLTPNQGNIKWDPKTRIGYFAQHQLEELDAKATPLLELQRWDPLAKEQSLRNYLGGFGFAGERAECEITILSGGEKARLVLALIIYRNPNLLLLDEPTNHLDLEMREALVQALQWYEGGLLVVSHDRHLLRTITDDLWLVNEGKVVPFDGDVEAYQAWAMQQKSQEAAGLAQNPGADTRSKREQRQKRAELREQLAPLRKKIHNLEQQHQELEAQAAAIDQRLVDSRLYEAENKSQLQALILEKHTLSQSLEALEEDWVLANDELERLQQAQAE